MGEAAGRVERCPPSCGSGATCASRTTRRCSTRPARDGDVLPLFVVDPALWGPSGPSRRRYLTRVAARPRRARRPGGPHRRPGHRGRPRRARGRGRPGPRRRRLRPLRPRPRREGRRGPGEARHRAGPHRVVVRRGAGAGDQGRRHAVPGVHAVLPRLDRARLAGPGRRPRSGELAGGRLRRRTGRAAPRRPRPAGRRRGGGRAALAGLPPRAPRGLRPRARPSRPRHHLTHVGAPQVGRDPPAHDARRPEGL